MLWTKQMKSACEPLLITESAIGNCVVASASIDLLVSMDWTAVTPASLTPFNPFIASHDARGVFSCDLPSALRTLAMVDAASGVDTLISGVPTLRADVKFSRKFIGSPIELRCCG